MHPLNYCDMSTRGGTAAKSRLSSHANLLNNSNSYRASATNPPAGHGQENPYQVRAVWPSALRPSDDSPSVHLDVHVRDDGAPEIVQVDLPVAIVNRKRTWIDLCRQ